MTFRQLLAVLWRRRLVVLVCVVVAVGAAGAYLKVRKPSYTASATVQLAAPAGGGGSAPAVNIPDPLVELAGTSLAKQAGSEAGGHLDAQVTGTVDSTSNVLTVAATSPTAAGAQRAANAYARAYVDSVASAVSAQEAKIADAMSKLNLTIATLEAQDPTGKNAAIAAQITSSSQAYAALSTQRQTLQINSPYVSVQNPAVLPTAPSGTSKSKIGGLGLLVGLLAGCGVALVREQFDSRLQSNVDVAEVTGRPVLAEVPVDSFSAKSDWSVAVVDDAQSLFSESIRELRTSLRVLLEEKPGALVLMTSPAPGDGKTLVTANLGAAWAMVDRKVVVVSADFRRPRIEQMFGLQKVSSPGLAQLLSFRRGRAEAGSAPTVDAIRELPTRDEVAGALVATRVDDLWILPSGGSPPNPSELLDGPAMGAVLDHLASLADVVLFDAPPVLPVTDPAILGRSVSGVVVVASEGATDRKDLETTVQRLDATGSAVLGIVLNRSRHSVATSYHPYYAPPPAR